MTSSKYNNASDLHLPSDIGERMSIASTQSNQIADFTHLWHLEVKKDFDIMPSAQEVIDGIHLAICKRIDNGECYFVQSEEQKRDAKE